MAGYSSKQVSPTLELKLCDLCKAYEKDVRLNECYVCKETFCRGCSEYLDHELPYVCHPCAKKLTKIPVGESTVCTLCGNHKTEIRPGECSLCMGTFCDDCLNTDTYPACFPCLAIRNTL